MCDEAGNGSRLEGTNKAVVLKLKLKNGVRVVVDTRRTLLQVGRQGRYSSWSSCSEMTLVFGWLQKDEKVGVAAWDCCYQNTLQASQSLERPKIVAMCQCPWQYCRVLSAIRDDAHSQKKGGSSSCCQRENFQCDRKRIMLESKWRSFSLKNSLIEIRRMVHRADTG